MVAPLSEAVRIAGSVSPEETAAIVAALKRFASETAPAQTTVGDPPHGWTRAAMLEGVARAQQDDLIDPWINT